MINKAPSNVPNMYILDQDGKYKQAGSKGVKASPNQNKTFKLLYQL
jgi:hypothetical protein